MFGWLQQRSAARQTHERQPHRMGQKQGPPRPPMPGAKARRNGVIGRRGLGLEGDFAGRADRSGAGKRSALHPDGRAAT